MRITVLAGGIGAARFLRGLKAAAPDAQITVVGHTGDDITLFGLRVCPDLDTVMYTWGGGINPEQGWGRADESFAIRDELAAYGAGPSWFTLGDRDFATHILRTQLLATGKPLSEVTRLLCDRWQPGVRLLPMSDDRVETHVTLAGDPGAGDPGSGAGSPGGAAPSTQVIHFQEWWVRLHASVPAQAILPVGAAEAAPAPGVLDAISEADFVLFPPSNPVVSIGPILAVPGIRDATAAKTVVGVSGIIGGAPVDKAAADDPACAGIEIRALPLYMRDLESTAAIARAAIDLALEIALCRLSRRLPVRFRAQSQSRQPSPSRVSPGCRRSALAMIWRHFSPARCSPMTALALPTATSSLSRRRWSARPRGGWSRPPAGRPSRRRPRA